MKSRELLQTAIVQLEQAACDAPRREAELLLRQTWDISATSLMIKMMDEVPTAIEADFKGLIKRRMAREPLAYILGYKEFWSNTFEVSSDVLVPRPETEHLIESVLKYYPDQNKALRICDIGTGSGCVAVTLALEYPHAEVVACDISEQALIIAKKNAQRLNVTDRMQFIVGDLYQALPSESHFDIIVSNPPYVSKDQMLDLEPELLCEPRFALTDEDSGLTFLARLIQDAPQHLLAEGMLILESGLCGMPKPSVEMIKVEDYFDLAGNFRGTVFRKA